MSIDKNIMRKIQKLFFLVHIGVQKKEIGHKYIHLIFLSMAKNIILIKDF